MEIVGESWRKLSATRDHRFHASIALLSRFGYLEKIHTEEGRGVRLLKVNDPALHGINFHELEARRQFEYKKFGVMLDYASRFRKHCYRSFILSYFGEWNRKRDCGNCSRCNANKFPRDAKFEQLVVPKQKTRSGEAAQASATIVALKILSCVLRAHQRLGREKIAKILAGSVDSSVQDYRSLSTYGLLSEYSIKSIVAMIDYLLAENYIAQETGFRPSIYVTPKGEVFLKERPEIEIPGVSPRA
jgi:ATP-dependent DNA helicase RecQ